MFYEGVDQGHCVVSDGGYQGHCLVETRYCTYDADIWLLFVTFIFLFFLMTPSFNINCY